MEETTAHKPLFTEDSYLREAARLGGGNANSGLVYYLLEVMK